MPWFGIVLYLHLLAVAAALFFAACVHRNLERAWNARTTPAALAALRLAARASAGLLWTALALLATGARLTQSAFTWTTPWIDLSLLALIALAALAAITRAHCHRSAATPDPLLRAANPLLPLLTLAIMLVMIIKPSALAASVILIASTGPGVFLRRREKSRILRYNLLYGDSKRRHSRPGAAARARRRAPFLRSSRSRRRHRPRSHPHPVHR